MAIGDNVKLIRNEKKLTQAALAEKMGISRSYLSDIENNRKNPSSKTIESLAEKLGVSMLYLTTGEKTIDDLYIETGKEVMHGVLNHMKEEVQEVISSELRTYEISYLSAMVRFLKTANKDEVIGLTLITTGLIKTLRHKKDDIDKDELNDLLKCREDEITDFLHKYFFNDNKEGD